MALVGRSFGRRPLLLLLLLVLQAACGRERIPGPEPLPARTVDPARTESVLFLVGDAGEATRGTHPILTRLRDDIEWWSEALPEDGTVTVLFLGDIVYPVGLHDRGTQQFPGDSTIAMDQALLLAGPEAQARGAQGYFLAGNHDWGLESDWKGARRLANLSDFLIRAAEHTGANVSLQPPAGTGGPTVVDLGEHVRLLLLDTAWWLLYDQIDEGLARDGVLKAIEEAILDAGDREIVFAAHHPFRSAGPHGGEFDFWETFGIRYLLARSGALLQDVSSIPYRELEEGMRDIFARRGAPLLFIGGHEHSLQILYGVTPNEPTYNLVSGAASKSTPVGDGDGLQFGMSAPGYMRLVVGDDGGMDVFVEAAPSEYLSCSGSEQEVAACVQEGVAAFRTVHAQRIR